MTTHLEKVSIFVDVLVNVSILVASRPRMVQVSSRRFVQVIITIIPGQL